MYLNIKDLKKSYGEGGSYIQVLKGVSADIEKGYAPMGISLLFSPILPFPADCLPRKNTGCTCVPRKVNHYTKNA